MNIDLTYLFLGLITVAFGVLMVYGVPALKAYLTTEQERHLNYWLTVAVQAAEEAKRNGILANGDEQFADAKDFLESMGYTFDDKKVTALIKAKVWEIINQFKEDKVAEAEVIGFCTDCDPDYSEEVGGTE